MRSSTPAVIGRFTPMAAGVVSVALLLGGCTTTVTGLPVGVPVTSTSSPAGPVSQVPAPTHR